MADRGKEKKLVGKILRGDRRSFEGFFSKQKISLKKYLQFKVGNDDDVEELLQDTFLSFLDSLPLFGFRSSLKTYLYSIARHEIADYYRRRYAKRVLKLVPIVGELAAQEIYSTEELSGQIDKVYREIIPRYAEVLQLKYEEEMSVKQIAKKLRLSVKAAESRLFRARKAFQLVFLEGANETASI